MPDVQNFDHLVTDQFLSELAKQVAADVRDLDSIISDLGVSREVYEQIARLPRFQVFLVNARMGWNSTDSVEERLKVKAAVALEEAIPEFFARIHDPKETLTSKAAAGELLRKISGTGAVKADGSGGERFSLVINIGGQQQTAKTIEGEVINTVDYSKVPE